MTENLLISELRRGNEDAFRQIYNQYYLFLLNFATQILKNDSIAEEIVDDSIFYLWEHRNDMNTIRSVRSYLLTTVRNRCLSEMNSLAYRSEVSFSAYAGDDNLDLMNIIFDEEHPLGSLIEKELTNEINRCIDSLPKECAAVFKKSRFEDKTYMEIAEELNISVNTVKYHIKKALSYLHENLKDIMPLLIMWIINNQINK